MIIATEKDGEIKVPLLERPSYPTKQVKFYKYNVIGPWDVQAFYFGWLK